MIDRTMDQADCPFEVQSEEVVYLDKWICVCRAKLKTATGAELTYTYVNRSDAVVIVPYCRATNGIYLIETYRYPSQCWSVEFPAGIMDDGLSPEDVAVKELSEELGARCVTLEKLASLDVCNGTLRMKMHFFVSEVEEFLDKKKLEAGEIVRSVHHLTPARVRESCLDGTITDADSVLAWNLAQEKIECIVTASIREPVPRIRTAGEVWR